LHDQSAGGRQLMQERYGQGAGCREALSFGADKLSLCASVIREFINRISSGYV
jgi:hypothetical protein